VSIKELVEITVGSLVRFRYNIDLPLSTPMRVIQVREDIVRLEDGIWWPVGAVISEQEWHEWYADKEPV